MKSLLRRLQFRIDNERPTWVDEESIVGDFGSAGGEGPGHYDFKVDIYDLMIFAGHWLEGTE